MVEFKFISNIDDNVFWLPQAFWEKEWDRTRPITKITKVALEIAQDVECVELETKNKVDNDTNI